MCFAAFSRQGVTKQTERGMRIFVAIVFIAANCTIAMAQAVAPTDRPGACPPGSGQNPPTVGKESDKSLSDQLTQSKGVICPPAGIDPEMHQTPPQGGAMKVVPPPGSPAENPNVQPK